MLSLERSGLANHSRQLAIGGTAFRSSSGYFSPYQLVFLAVVRRLRYFQLPCRQVGPVKGGNGG